MCQYITYVAVLSVHLYRVENSSCMFKTSMFFFFVRAFAEVQIFISQNVFSKESALQCKWSMVHSQCI